MRPIENLIEYLKLVTIACPLTTLKRYTQIGDLGKGDIKRAGCDDIGNQIKPVKQNNEYHQKLITYKKI